MNQKTRMRYTSEKGITLIALVITIIVLLILAGVTISMVLGDDGIIAQAEEARENHNQSSEKELVNLAITESMTENLVNGTKGVNVAKLRTSLEKTLGADVIVEEQGEKVLVKTENGQFEIVKNTGKITELEVSDIVKIKVYENREVTEKMANIADEVATRGLIVANGYITNIEPGTTVGELRANLPSTYKIYEIGGKTEIPDDNTKEKEGNNKKVTTGMVVKNGEEPIGKTIIFGDVDGDGIANSMDGSFINGATIGGSLNTMPGEDCFRVAGDVTGDGWIKAEDATLISQSTIGGPKPKQNRIAKHPNDIIVGTNEMIHRAEVDAIISSSSTFSSKNYKMEWSKENSLYVVTLSSDLSISTFAGYFAGKKVELWREDENGTWKTITTGNIFNNDEVDIDGVTCFRFKASK